MKFEFATASRILFGRGTSGQAGALAKSLGSRALVVTGKDPNRAGRLIENLESSGLATRTLAVTGEPRIETISQGVAEAKIGECELVVAVGGGSAIDAGKAIAAMLSNPGEVLDYLEVVGRGQTIKKKSAPFIAVPTTAGTGSEVTRNAVLGSPEHHIKASLRSAYILPDVALIDPELTLGLPAAITATTGLDALTQLIEPFVSCRANPFTDAICRDGIARAARALPSAFAKGTDVDAREEMSLCSLYGGLALANAGLGAVHGFAGPIGGMFPAPHGAICAALLPHVFEVNLRAVRERQADTLPKFDEVAVLLTGDPKASADNGVSWLKQLIRNLAIPSLRRYDMSPADIPDVVQKAKVASSMKANPLTLSDAELREILERAL